MRDERMSLTTSCYATWEAGGGYFRKERPMWDDDVVGTHSSNLLSGQIFNRQVIDFPFN